MLRLKIFNCSLATLDWVSIIQALERGGKPWHVNDLKGPKLEIFGFRFFFIQSRLVWVGDLGTRPKNLKF